MKETQKKAVVDGVELTFVFKKVKHLRITITEGKGRVVIPPFITEKKAEDFVRQKLAWIQRHLERGAPLVEEYNDGDRLSLWGREYTIVTSQGANRCAYDDERIYLQTRDGSLEAKRKLVNRLFRSELESKAEEYLAYWQGVTELQCSSLTFRDMKTRWGSCNINTKKIRLSLRLARYDENCTSYVVLHELLHLVERYHNKRFYALLTHYYPEWEAARRRLCARDVR
ncbi:MAG: SprT family zinc-dependent metalloprotease [Clostridia bacterium]|nr:SprT family zinc-dependent metalloprotease [Clostridia bacterium]